MTTRSPPKIVVTRTTAFGQAADGNFACVEFVDQNGVTAVIMIPVKLAGEFLSRFQGACFAAAKVSAQDLPGSIVSALVPESVDIGVHDDQRIGLRLKLSIGMTMDIDLSDTVIASLKKALADLDAYRKAGGSPSAH